MIERKKLLRIFSGLVFFMFLVALIPTVGTAAPKKSPPSADVPITANEWAAKIGLDWGPKYWPTKPVRGGVWQTAQPLYVGLMNPNHWPVNDWTTISEIYDKLIWTDGSYKSTIPFLAESWKFLDPKTVIMKLRKGVTFHDGSPFNAESVKYQMDWIKDPQTGPGPGPGSNRWNRSKSSIITPLNFISANPGLHLPGSCPTSQAI